MLSSDIGLMSECLRRTSLCWIFNSIRKSSAESVSVAMEEHLQSNEKIHMW